MADAGIAGELVPLSPESYDSLQQHALFAGIAMRIASTETL
ncbi:hypothetical protein [Novosphingobium soli]